MRTWTRFALGFGVLVALGMGAPTAAAAQSVVGKIKRAAKQKVTEQKERTEQEIVDEAVEPLDSTLVRADSVVTHMARAVVAALKGEPREVRRLTAALRRGRAVLHDVTFVHASEQLDSASVRQLVALVEALPTVEGTFVIAAHVESLGGVSQVEHLSARRAAVVKEWLVAGGIPAQRLFTQAIGATRALARIELRRLD